MARGVNKAIIVGNLGHDPEPRQSTNGDPLVTLNFISALIANPCFFESFVKSKCFIIF